MTQKRPLVRFGLFPHALTAADAKNESTCAAAACLQGRQRADLRPAGLTASVLVLF
jgi:hypothetical protein